MKVVCVSEGAPWVKDKSFTLGKIYDVEISNSNYFFVSSGTKMSVPYYIIKMDDKGHGNYLSTQDTFKPLVNIRKAKLKKVFDGSDR